MVRRFALWLVMSAISLSAAEFENYQAARAVIGQVSFSAHDAGIAAVALSVSNGSLYAASSSGHVLSFDLSRIGTDETSGCPVCLVSPNSSVAQNVFPTVAAVAVNGRNIAIADAESRSVLLWNNTSSGAQPSVVIGGFIRPTAVALDSDRLFVADAGTHHVFVWNRVPTNASQVANVTLGATDGFDFPSADSIQNPTALASDGTNLYVADAAAHRVLVFSASDEPAPHVLNAASLTAGALAPGTLIALEHASTKTNVFLNGEPLRATDSNGGQLQLQIPYELNNATAASLWTESPTSNGTISVSRAAPIHFTSASPGIFAFGTKEPRTGMLMHAPDSVPLSPEDPARPSELLTVWATGLGAISSDTNNDGSFNVLMPVRASVNGIAAEVISATLPADSTGVYEVRLRLPSELPKGANLVLIANETKSNPVAFPVQTN